MGRSKLKSKGRPPPFTKTNRWQLHSRLALALAAAVTAGAAYHWNQPPPPPTATPSSATTRVESPTLPRRTSGREGAPLEPLALRPVQRLAEVLDAALLTPLARRPRVNLATVNAALRPLRGLADRNVDAIVLLPTSTKNPSHGRVEALEVASTGGGLSLLGCATFNNNTWISETTRDLP